MSHVVGTVQPVAPVVVVGPDGGSAATSPGVWEVAFAYQDVPGGAKFIILHFSNVNLPGGNRLEVELGYDVDVFTAADGGELWTRPIDPLAFPGGAVTVRYRATGAAAGGATLDRYGRGERHAGIQDPTALSNCDPFLHDATYTEPKYDPFWFCRNGHPTPFWENSACVPSGDVRADVARSVGMILTVELSENVVSTCSVTLIGPDTVLTAGHCHTPADALTASVIFNYETDCAGTRPGGYAPRFHKVVKVMRHRHGDGTTNDYSILQLRLPPGGLSIPPVALRHDVPGVDERVFNVSHPNGAVKKQSMPHPNFATLSSVGVWLSVNGNIDVSGGSSGSGLFDSSGRYLGVLSNGGPCALNWYPITTMLADIAAMPDVPLERRDVMVVFDRSGSMSLPAGTGRSKIEEARDAAALFFELVRAGSGNRTGLASFSTAATAPVDAELADVTSAEKATLVGPPPYTSGIVGSLAPAGSTSIGGGLAAAVGQLVPAGSNPRAILLMTDGLQNTPPMIADVQGALAGIDVHAIGFGTEADLDGVLLSRLTQAHNGLYTRAGSPLDLKKFFALAFGNIFEAGALTDPPQTLPASQPASEPLHFDVFDEDTLTVVVGWDGDDVDLDLRVAAPSGTNVSLAGAGVDSAAGSTWRFARIPLPQGGEREGAWTVTVLRPPFAGELGPPDRDITYFVSVIARGGPKLHRQTPERIYYTGDTITPMVGLTYPEGGAPPRGRARVVVTRPVTGVGEVATQAEARPAATVDGDTIPARQATLAGAVQQAGGPAVAYREDAFDLYDDPERTGQFEAAGIFGAPFADLLTTEGDYTFHATATYGDTAPGAREITWTVYVDLGVDPARTGISTTVTGSQPGGGRNAAVTIVPRDRYGSHLGPGRADSLDVSGAAGTTVTGPATDNGDGSYTYPAVLAPGTADPTIVVGQHARPPVVVGGTVPTTDGGEWRWWKLLCLLLALIVLILLALLLIKWQ